MKTWWSLFKPGRSVGDEAPELWWEELEESPYRKRRTNHWRSKESEYYLDSVYMSKGEQVVAEMDVDEGDQDTDEAMDVRPHGQDPRGVLETYKNRSGK